MIETIPDFKLLNPVPSQRDPRVCPFGVYVVFAFSRGGEQGFHWFKHEADVIHFISRLDGRSPYAPETRPNADERVKSLVEKEDVDFHAKLIQLGTSFPPRIHPSKYQNIP